MTCLHSDFVGNCTMFDDAIENAGWDKTGICICEDDPAPGFTCEMFECSYCHNEGCEDCDEDFEY